MRRILLIALSVALVLVLGAGLVACAGDSAQQPAAPTTTDTQNTDQPSTGTDSGDPAAADPDRALVENKCSLCHTTERVFAANYDEATWSATIDRMKSNGLVITDEEYSQIVAYLSSL